MNSEQKREQLLKRVLPVLSILVIYFVFVNGFVGDKVKKAKQDYESIKLKGISAASLPNMRNEMSRTKDQVRKLTGQQQSYRNQLKGMAGFLYQSQTNNKSTKLLSEILAKHHVAVIEEKSDQIEELELPLTAKEVRNWLKQSDEQKEDSIDVQYLLLSGTYSDMYQAMLEMAKSRFPAIPVHFSMLSENASDDIEFNNIQQWELVLWM